MGCNPDNLFNAERRTRLSLLTHRYPLARHVRDYRLQILHRSRPPPCTDDGEDGPADLRCQPEDFADAQTGEVRGLERPYPLYDVTTTEMADGLTNTMRRQPGGRKGGGGGPRSPARASCWAGFSFAFFYLPTLLLMFAGFLFQIAGTVFLFARRSARPISISSVRM